MNRTILVVEDDLALCGNIEFILKKAGYEVIIKNTGGNIPEIITANKIDLVLCDVHLPEKNGFEILEELHNELEIYQIPPFLFLTALVEKSDIRQGMDLGADDYLTKPYTRDEVLSAISTQLKKREKLLQRFNPEIKTIDKIEDESGTESLPCEDNRLDYNSSIRVEHENVIKLVKVSDIVEIDSDMDYTIIRTAGKESYITCRTMKTWETILPENHFKRIHISMIINLEYIVKYEHWFNCSYRVYLKGIEEPVIVSKRYSQFLSKND